MPSYIIIVSLSQVHATLVILVIHHTVTAVSVLERGQMSHVLMGFVTMKVSSVNAFFRSIILKIYCCRTFSDHECSEHAVRYPLLLKPDVNGVRKCMHGFSIDFVDIQTSQHEQFQNFIYFFPRLSSL